MDGGDDVYAFLDRLNLRYLPVAGFALNLCADLCEFCIAATKDRAKNKRDKPKD